MNALPVILDRHERSNFNSFEMFGIRIWFSYNTPVAFKVGSNQTVVRVNTWGPVTGKHLNSIDGGNRSARVSAEQFRVMWELQTLRFYGASTQEPYYRGPDYQPAVGTD